MVTSTYVWSLVTSTCLNGVVWDDITSILPKLRCWRDGFVNRSRLAFLHGPMLQVLLHLGEGQTSLQGAFSLTML